MIITEIYNDFKKNLPKEQYEIEFNGENFRIYLKEYNKLIHLLVCEKWVIIGFGGYCMTIDYKSEKTNIIEKQVIEILIFVKKFAKEMENVILCNSEKYGFIKIIQGV